MVIAIADKEDPRLSAYREVRERDLSGRDGLFILEGEVVVRLAIERGLYPIQSLLIAENRLDKLLDVIATLAPEIPVFVAPRKVFDAVAGFAVHRGVLAVGKRADADSADALVDPLPASALVVVLCGLANHDNVGGVFRNAAAFGADAVFLDSSSCDPLYRKAIRVSVGTALVVPFFRGGTAFSLCTLLHDRGFSIALATPRGALDVTMMPPARRRAVVFGAEGSGLPDDLLARFETITIPMSGGIDSLNVATSSGITLFHAARRRVRS